MAELSPQEVFGTGSPFTALAEELEAMYPLTNPSPKDDDRMIMATSFQAKYLGMSGEELVNHLLEIAQCDD